MMQLAREPFCRTCMGLSLYVPATQVDHINPHHGDPIAFFAGPFQSLCDICHTTKTNKERNQMAIATGRGA